LTSSFLEADKRKGFLSGTLRNPFLVSKMCQTLKTSRSIQPGEKSFVKNGFNAVAGVRQKQREVPDSFSVHTVAQMNISDVPFDAFTLYLSKLLKRSARLIERRKVKEIFVRKLRKFGFKSEADKLEKCSANFTTLVCGNGHSFRPIVDYRCHQPFCPDCWELKSRRELGKALPKFLQALKDDKSLIVASFTSTIKSDKKRGLTAGNGKLKADFKKLRNRKIWKNCVGGSGRIENTFSKKFGWHPHLHSVLLLKDYIPQNQLSDALKSITGDSMIVYIRQVHDLAAGLVETIKYPFKPADLKRLGKEQIQEMLDSKGEKLGVSFGVLFGLEVESDIEEQSEFVSEYAEFVEETKVLEMGDACPICQSRLDLIDFTAKGYASFLGSIRLRPPLIC
jgi:hypothetical protein